MQEIALPHQQKVVCVLLSHPLCFTVCAAVLCPQTVHPTALLHPQGRTLQSYKDYSQQPTAASHTVHANVFLITRAHVYCMVTPVQDHTSVCACACVTECVCVRMCHRVCVCVCVCARVCVCIKINYDQECE